MRPHCLICAFETGLAATWTDDDGSPGRKSNTTCCPCFVDSETLSDTVAGTLWPHASDALDGHEQRFRGGNRRRRDACACWTGDLRWLMPVLAVRLISLASGSSGNSLLVQNGSAAGLIDCGIGPNRLRAELLGAWIFAWQISVSFLYPTSISIISARLRRCGRLECRSSPARVQHARWVLHRLSGCKSGMERGSNAVASKCRPFEPHTMRRNRSVLSFASAL